MNTDKKDSLIEVLVLNRDELNAIARKYGANNIRIFGSVARREESASSDIDLLVDMDENASLLDLARLKNELEDLLGKTVDISTKPALHPLLAEDILKEAIPL